MKAAKVQNLIAAACQFRACADMGKNLRLILKNMEKAARKHARLIAFPECALTGYAPAEIPDYRNLDPRTFAAAKRDIARAAKRLNMWVTFGSATPAPSGCKPEGCHPSLAQQIPPRAADNNTGHARKISDATRPVPSADCRAWHNSLLLISPAGKTACIYHKRELYGREEDCFVRGAGNAPGLTRIDGIRAGLRICFEFRFPEYFRELLLAEVRLAIVSFCMTGKTPAKLPVARAHLQSRAAENGLFILAANSAAPCQNCPSAIIGPDGIILAEARADREEVITAKLDFSEQNWLVADIRRRALALAARNG